MDTIDIDDLTKALQEIAARSSKEVVDKIHKGIDRISRETLQEVKEQSPVYEGKSKKLKKGKYRDSWETSTLDRNGTHRKTVHNKQYQLVHLLELGHLTRKGTGHTAGKGREKTRAFKHVEPVEQHAEEKVDALLEGL